MDATLAAQLFLMRVRRLLAAGKLVWNPRNKRKTGDVMVFFHPYTLQATPGGKILPPMGMPVS